jgi:hypothetical protein
MFTEIQTVRINGADILYPIKPSDRNSDKVSMYSIMQQDALTQ